MFFCAKVLNGRPDQRTAAFRVKHQVDSKAFNICTKFLQLRYHNDGEYLPDRFVFEGALKDRSLMIGNKVDLNTPMGQLSDDSDLSDDAGGNSKDDLDEEDSRALTALSMKALVMSAPFHQSLTGPGAAPGPRRYLGVMKPANMFEMMKLWCAEAGEPAPSFSTFLRALKAARPWLSFRKSAGQHGLCDSCVHYKRELRKNLQATLRQQVVEEYAAHLLLNFRDRAADSAWHAQCVQTRQMLLAGKSTLQLMQQSVLLLRSDGLDQAKHKVPRCLTHSKAFEDVIRPAMHCQMVWCHCWGFQFALSDPDVRKDSATHCDALARSLSRIYDASGALPRQLYVVLDNTCKDNKNQHMMKFWAKLCLMHVFESIYVAFPVKGHTHGPLDGVGGHAVVRCSHETWDTAEELVKVYQRFLDTAQFESGTVFKDAYKHDNSADWFKWLDDIDLAFKGLTGPKAPHGFRFLERKLLSPEENAMSHDDGSQLPCGHPDDLMMAVHQYMSDARPYQVVMLMSAAKADRVRRQLTVQPSGQHTRKAVSWDDRIKVRAKAMTGFERGAISEAARDFLIGWIQGTTRRKPRPSEYTFLKHRFNAGSVVGGPGVAKNPHDQGEPRPIIVLKPKVNNNRQMPLDEEDVDDRDEEDLVIQDERESSIV